MFDVVVLCWQLTACKGELDCGGIGRYMYKVNAAGVEYHILVFNQDQIFFQHFPCVHTVQVQRGGLALCSMFLMFSTSQNILGFIIFVQRLNSSLFLSTTPQSAASYHFSNILGTPLKAESTCAKLTWPYAFL